MSMNDLEGPVQQLQVHTESAVGDALPASAIRAQVDLIQHVMREVMQQDTHYGVIPGTPKPTLLKPGAEKLCLTFRLDPQYVSTERFVGDHLFVKSTCTLHHQTSGRRLGSGEGSCSTKESKYAYRKGQRLCPNCGKETIIKGKPEYGGGWLCYAKKGGCNAKWPDGTKEIEDQNTDRVPNEDVADQYNTVLKMANKRSLVAAVLNVTGASDIFTQDIEDMPQFAQTQQQHSSTAHDEVTAKQTSDLKAVQEKLQASKTQPPAQAPKTSPEPTAAHKEALAGEYPRVNGDSLHSPDTFVWQVGKTHSSKDISEIPLDYMEWFVKKGKRADHVAAAKAELERVQNQPKISALCEAYLENISVSETVSECQKAMESALSDENINVFEQTHLKETAERKLALLRG